MNTVLNRAVRAVVVVLALAGMAIVATATPAAATTDDYALRSVATGYCVDDSFEYGLRSYPCNGLNYQRFNSYPQPDGTFVLQNQRTGRCIDDSIEFGLRAFNCYYSTYQRWERRLVWISSGGLAYTFVSQATGLCMDDSPQYRLRAYFCNGQPYQQFLR
jgi:hypothetical protein